MEAMGSLQVLPNISTSLVVTWPVSEGAPSLATNHLYKLLTAFTLLL